MTINEKLEMYKRKKTFVDNVSKAFETCTVGTGVVSVDYEVYKKEISDDITYFVEYIVVNFTGGGKSVRNVNGNSHNANFREIGKLIDGGYYDEIKDYEIMLERDFTKVEV